jgi:hypothetical protein
LIIELFICGGGGGSEYMRSGFSFLKVLTTLIFFIEISVLLYLVEFASRRLIQ